MRAGRANRRTQPFRVAACFDPPVVNILIVAVGGALGAVGRYLVVSAMATLGGAFPYGTLTVNVLGGLLMGLLVEAIALGLDVPAQLRLALVVGVLGGFTTFSSFSLDVYALMENGRLAGAAVYVAASVILSIGALFAGIALARALATTG
jgi:CrcB protein